MDNAMMLFGYLVIALLGFVVPVLGFLLSIYQGGIDKLKIKYEYQKAEAEKAKQDYLSSLLSGNVIQRSDLSGIKMKIKELELSENRVKKSVDFKLGFLDIKTTAMRFAGPMLLSMLSVMAFFVLPVHLKNATVAVSIAFFFYSIYILVKILDVVVEMTRLADRESKDMNARIIEALAEGPDHSGVKQLNLVIDGKKSGAELTLSAGETRDFKLEVENPGKVPARNTQLKIKLPEGFDIEQRPYYTLARANGGYLVAYTIDFIHPETSILCGPLVIRAPKPVKGVLEYTLKPENSAKETAENFVITVSQSIEDAIVKALGIE
jgi:ABC-type multidrug transport system fused ATPase/permease subunit